MKPLNGLYEFLIGMRVAYKTLAFASDETREKIKKIALEMGEELERVIDKYLDKEDQDEFANAVIALYFCMIGMGSSLVREMDFNGEDFMNMAYEFFRICLKEKGLSIAEGLVKLRDAVMKTAQQGEEARERFLRKLRELQGGDREVV